MSIEISPTAAAAGAEIHGVDLARPMTDADFGAIEKALYTHGVVFLRDQHITPAQQIDFTRRFGEPEINFHAQKFGVDGRPEIYKVSNIVEDGRAIGTPRAGSTWHTDMSYAERPARATMLHAIEVPSLHGLTLGDTGFANAAAAWDALPAAMRDTIRDLQGVFDFRGRKRAAPISAADIARYPPVQHPLVRTHFYTGRKSLYVARDDCTAIVGRPDEEGRALIEALADHIVKPQFVYQHRWQQGDVVIWDNCTVQHRAVVDYDLPQRRLMWRTTVKGDVPR